MKFKPKRGVMRTRLIVSLTGAGLMAVLAGCAWGDPNSTYPEYQKAGGHGPHSSTPPQSVFGGTGLTLFSTDKPKDQGDEGGGSGIGVNSYLWRASLDTIAFMPLASAAPFCGGVITDWDAPGGAPNEG